MRNRVAFQVKMRNFASAREVSIQSQNLGRQIGPTWFYNLLTVNTCCMVQGHCTY